MSLIPGGRLSGKYSLADGALANSLALAMEEEFALVYQGVKNAPLPPTARQDMRMLWVSVARGLLRYLRDNDTTNITALDAVPNNPHHHQVDFDVNMG